MQIKMRIGLLTAVCLAVVGCPVTQPTLLGITIPTAPFQQGRSINEKPDGSLLVGGTLGQDNVLSALCIDGDGNRQFSVSPADVYLGVGVSGRVPITVTPSGEIVVAGNSEPSGESLHVIRYNTFGEPILDKTYSFLSSIGGVLGVVSGFSDDVIVAANTDTATGFAPLVVAVDDQGAILWTSTLNDV